MKSLLYAFVCLSVFSCGKTNKTNGGESLAFLQQDQKKTIPKYQDSDFDGITDNEEKKAGMNPFVADIPHVSFHFLDDISVHSTFLSRKDGSLVQESINFEKLNGAEDKELKQFISLLAYNELYNEDLEANKFKSFEELYKKEVGCLSFAKAKKFLVSYHSLIEMNEFKNKMINLKYQINIGKIKNLKSIQKVKGEILLNQFSLGNFLNDKVFYQLGNDHFDYKEIQNTNIRNEKKIEKNIFSNYENCLAVAITDFQYKINQKLFSYKKQMEKIKQKLAHIIIYKDGTFKKFSINPNHYTLEKFLNELGAKVKFGYSGDIVNLFGVRNEFDSLEYLDLSQRKDLDKRKWFFLTRDRSKPIETLKSGSIYYLVNLKTEELLRVKKTRSQITSSHRNQLVVEDVLPGDQIILTSKVYGTYNSPADSANRTRGYWGPFGRDIKPNLCEVREYNQFPGGKRSLFEIVNPSEFIIHLKDRELIPEKVEGELIYSFIISWEDLKDGKLKINFPQKSFADYPYTRWTQKFNVNPRRAEGFCYRDRRNNNVLHRQRTSRSLRSNKIFDYKTEITRRGIYR